MVFRTVNTTILDPTTGEPLEGEQIRVTLSSGSFSTEGDFFAKKPKIFTSGSDGKISMNLWTSQESNSPVNYNFVLPGNYSFDSIVPFGDGQPIQLAALELLSIPPTSPLYNTLFYAVIAEIASSGGGGGGNADLSNYYNKPQVDTKLAAAIATINIGNYFTKAEINSIIAGLGSGNGGGNVDLSNYYTKAQTDSNVATALSTVYTKIQSDANLANALLGVYTKAQSDSNLASALLGVYTKAQSDTNLSNAIAALNIGNFYNKSQVDAKIAAVSIPGSGGNLTSATYDTQNRLTSVTINGITYTITYGSNTQIITGNSQVRTVTRDSAGNILSDITV